MIQFYSSDWAEALTDSGNCTEHGTRDPGFIPHLGEYFLGETLP